MPDVLFLEYGMVYGIQSLDLIKVGVTSNIEKRLNDMRLHNPHGVELVFYRKVYAPYTFERKMHELLADKALGREWFRATLADVRQAALTARLNSIKAKRKMDLLRRKTGMVVTHRTATTSDFKYLRG